MVQSVVYGRPCGRLSIIVPSRHGRWGGPRDKTTDEKADEIPGHGRFSAEGLPVTAAIAGVALPSAFEIRSTLRPTLIASCRDRGDFLGKGLTAVMDGREPGPLWCHGRNLRYSRVHACWPCNRSSTVVDCPELPVGKVAVGSRAAPRSGSCFMRRSLERHFDAES